MKSKLVVLFFLLPILAQAFVAPDPTKTPGAVCQPSDPDFKGYDYPEHVVRCNRDILQNEKLQVAKNYGNIPQSSWAEYEFDHMIPLCAGGANSISNLWPQPIAEAHQKDVLENDICLAMKAGTLKQADAIRKVRDWFQTRVQVPAEQNTLDFTYAKSTQFMCMTNDSTIIRFSVQDPKTVSDALVTLATANGEHEVIRADGFIRGLPVVAASPLLKDSLRFVLNKKADDHFELFLPLQFSTEADFKGYFKVSFEGNYPNLTEISCQQQ